MSRLSFIHTVWWLTLALWPRGSRATEPSLAAPAFDLPQRGGVQRAQLTTFRGRIVVLDFFAYWCVPCVRASTEVETGIRQFYESRKGNAHGIPVEVLAINIEASNPGRTEAFIQRTGLRRVFDDAQGEVFQKYGGDGMPFLVVIDATGGKSGDASPIIVYRKAGFEGCDKLRLVIDSIAESSPGPPAAAVGQAAPGAIPKANALPEMQIPQATGPVAAESPAPFAGRVLRPGISESNAPISITPTTTASTNAGEIRSLTGRDISHQLSLDFSMLRASDILLTDEQLEYRQTRSATEFSLTLSHGHIGLNYKPESALEHKTNLDEDRYGVQTSCRVPANDHNTVTVGGGAYYGYMDYRSLWFNEHFRQFFSGRQGYETAHPWGYNVSLGNRFEYLPTAGFAQADLTYQHDVISPGYDVSLASFPPKLIRFRDEFDTLSGQLSLENVLTRRLRTLQELQVLDTTDRQLRFTLRSSLNCALAEHWVSRLVLSGTRESPHFLSWSGSATVERDWNESWFCSLMARYYWDNGEIENALLAENTADPPLQTFETGLGLRWQGRKSSLKVFVGPYFTRYERVEPAINTFPHLYQNRSWLSVQFAFAHEF
jgi:thiol-disulfide isomerase/thioredoxin